MKETRRGQALVVYAAGVLVLGIIAALTIDAGNAYQARSRLQNAADAAALAAAQKMTEERNKQTDESTCREFATCEAQKLVNANWDAARFEIEFGRYDGNGQFVVQDSGTQAQAVRVKTVRDEAAPGGPLGAFFAPLAGIRSFDVSATAICKLTYGIWKVRRNLMPFAVFKDDVVPPGQTMVIYPSEQIVPGNFGLLNLDGGELSNAELKEWIANGYDGEVSIDPATGYVLITGDCGIKAGIKADVESRIGDTLLICVYDQVSAQGANATFRIIQFVAVTFTDMDLTGNDKFIAARVERIVYVADGESGAPWSDNLAKISLAY